MYDGVAFILSLVANIFPPPKINFVGAAPLAICYLPTFYTGRLIRIFILYDSIKKLVFNSCCFCDNAGLRSFHEDAFLYRGQQRLPIANVVGKKEQNQTPLIIPKQYQYQRFHSFYVDTLARV